MKSITLDPIVPTENQLKRIGKELAKPAFYILVAFLIGLFAFLFGLNYARAEVRAEMAGISAERDYLQSQLITAYGDNNRAQAAMAATIDKVDHDSYWTGWYNHCVYEKGIAFEEACWESAEKEMGK